MNREDSYAHNEYVLTIFTISYGKNNIAELPNTLRVAWTFHIYATLKTTMTMELDAQMRFDLI